MSKAKEQLGHYRIISKIGAGGMGDVYLAEDTRLNRKVALKVLPENIALDKERLLRFEREAFAVSALNHPNILTIFEFGAENGTQFLAAEYVSGETLREKLNRNSLVLSEKLDIAVQIASALRAAHSAGIIHRDIKPENIVIRADGYAKVLDFGLAKLTEPPASKNGIDEDAKTRLRAQTQAGMILGTVAYMSPEQARGKAIDARTDVFSFGVMLYEMFSGRQPFTGETINHAIVAILEKEPPSLSQFVKEIPVEIERIIEKCLRKSSSERYYSAELLEKLKECKEEFDFQEKLKRSTNSNQNTEAQTQIIKAKTTDKTDTQTSIAVLPFTNMSADAENEYFCDGLAEELLSALSKIEDLRVAARTSAFSFKGKNAEAREIGEKLSVKNILEGSVRRSADKLRIAVQLVNAADGFQLWSERYDRELKDIFDVQDEITLAVVDALKVKLFGEEKAAVLKRHTRNAEAYEHYLRGLFYFNRFTPDDFQKAIEYFNRAIAVDNRYASAFAGLANAYVEMAFFTFSAPGEWMGKAQEAVNTALALDETLGEAHNSLAIIKMYYDRDYRGAELEFKRALALDSGNAKSICGTPGFWA